MASGKKLTGMEPLPPIIKKKKKKKLTAAEKKYIGKGKLRKTFRTRTRYSGPTVRKQRKQSKGILV